MYLIHDGKKLVRTLISWAKNKIVIFQIFVHILKDNILSNKKRIFMYLMHDGKKLVGTLISWSKNKVVNFQVFAQILKDNLLSNKKAKLHVSPARWKEVGCFVH